jgi:small GTP-binding protein
MTQARFKLVLLGDSSVGKSCVASRFVTDDYHEFQEPTIGAAFLTKEIDIDKEKITYEIWDTAGQERYKSLAPMYYRGASAALIVFDITSRDSFDGAKLWVNEIYEKTINCFIMLVANKSDLIDESKDHEYFVNPEEVEEYAENEKISYIFTSARTGDNIIETFKIIGKHLIENKKNNKDKKDNNINVNLNENTLVSEKRRCC